MQAGMLVMRRWGHGRWASGLVSYLEEEVRHIDEKEKDGCAARNDAEPFFAFDRRASKEGTVHTAVHLRAVVCGRNHQCCVNIA